jgi:Fe-S cluster assembly protein SufB
MHRRGVDDELVRAISGSKGEPDWMRDLRLRSLHSFTARPLPTWGPDLSGLRLQDIYYFVPAETEKAQAWSDVPPEIRQDYSRLGVPEAERRFCTGLQAQFDSEMIYGSPQEELRRRGIIFTDTDTALREYPELFRKYFGSVVPPTDNKFAALNAAVWSGGTFVYVPAGVSIEAPLHGYFRVNAEQMGQFEHTLIVLEEGAKLSYVEACSAPMYPTTSLHAGVVEVVVGPHARCRFTSIQNWARDIYNLATKRAVAHEGALMEWIGGNIGSRVTMSYPSVHLCEPDSRAEILSLSVAGEGQHQDAGTKILHAAPDTTSQVISKSISRGGGRSTFRGLIQVPRGSSGSKSHVVCDSLILDPTSRCDTYPELDVSEQDVEIGHEASVSKIEREQLFYLMCRGLTEAEASEMVVSGFVEPLAKELPLCYASQLNDLIRLEMNAAVG